MRQLCNTIKKNSGWEWSQGLSQKHTPEPKLNSSEEHPVVVWGACSGNSSHWDSPAVSQH